jgi:hypothetical protein
MSDENKLKWIMKHESKTYFTYLRVFLIEKRITKSGY